MRELRIFDSGQDGRLVPLDVFLAVLRAACSRLEAAPWRVRGAYGYGSAVCAIEDRLAANEEVVLSASTVQALLGRRNEYFFHVTFTCTEPPVEFGLRDSTYLFLRSDDPRLLTAVRQWAKDVRVAQV